MESKFHISNDEFFKLSAAASEELSKKIPDLREQEFHDFIREKIVCFLIYVALYSLAISTIKAFRKTKETDDYVLDYEDVVIDRVSKWLCSFSLATCIGALLLLPFSITASEISRISPHNHYWKWINSTLLHGLWNLIFLFSNLSLFVFLPFSHLFIESIGLPGSQKGIKSRVIETILLLLLIAFCVIGISFVVTSVFDYDNPKRNSFLNILGYYLPFLYSFISFIGVLLLLICTPLGFSCLFQLVSNLASKQTFRDLREELDVAEMEYTVLKKQLFSIKMNSCEINLNHQLESLNKELAEKFHKIKFLKKQAKWNTICRNLFLLFILFILFFISVFGIILMLKNMFIVIFGNLPSFFNYDLNILHYCESLRLTFGFFNTIFEIALVIYFMIASFVGFYSFPIFSKILPKIKSTPMDKIILNCAIFVIFSSALPVSCKILGFTRYDLLRNFHDLYWLSNVYIIFFYNIFFAISIAVCCFGKKYKIRYEHYE